MTAPPMDPDPAPARPVDERRLFDAAVGLPATRREAFLRANCGHDAALLGRLRRLLSAHDAAEAISTEGVVAAAPELADEIGVGSRIGPYGIVAQLGAGGMGAVWLADQEAPVRRRVALKVVKLGMDTREVIARFEAERQTLARLAHPNIAQIHDAGATARGRPYFVMEYVPGATIVEYCDRARLDNAARIRLFLDVCDGVRHAHLRGVIHRDLKPSNILVRDDGDGQPVVKIIDFGIAKATTDTAEEFRTEVGRIIGTLEYMSPEQAGFGTAAIDIRTDVYSLGVVLYELLVGALPFDFATLRGTGLLSLQRAVTSDPPTTPAASLSRLGARADEVAAARGTTTRELRRTLRGEVEWIVMRALAKEPERRYQSVGALAEDLQRLLDGRPVDAGPPSELYRLRKAIGRHRVAFASACCLLVLVTGFSIHTASQSRQIAAEAARANTAAEAARRLAADEQRARSDAEAAQRAAERAAVEARDEAQKAELVTDFVRRILSSATPQVAQGEEITVRAVLDQSAREVDDGVLAAKPAVEAAVRVVLGSSYTRLGFAAAGRELLERALELQRGAGEPPLEIARTLVELVDAYYELGMYDATERALEEVDTQLTGLEATDEVREIERRAVVGLATLRQNQFRLDEALALRRGLVAELRDLPGADAVSYADAVAALAFTLIEMRQPAEAEQPLRNAILRLDLLGRQRHPMSVRLRELLGWCLTFQKEFEEGETWLRQALDLAKAVFPADHPRVADVLSMLANLHFSAGDYVRSEEVIREVLALRRARLGRHNDVATALERLSDLLRERGAVDEALAHARECLDIRIDTLGESSVGVAVARWRIGLALRLTGRDDEAVEAFRAAIDCWDRSPTPDHADAATPRRELAQVLKQRGDFDAARALLEQALERVRALGPVHADGHFGVRDELTDLALDAGWHDVALRLVDETLAGYRGQVPDTWLVFGHFDAQRGAALAGLGRLDEAEPLAIAGYERLARSETLPASFKFRAAELVRRVFAARGDAEREQEWAAKRDSHAAPAERGG